MILRSDTNAVLSNFLILGAQNVTIGWPLQIKLRPSFCVINR